MQRQPGGLPTLGCDPSKRMQEQGLDDRPPTKSGKTRTRNGMIFTRVRAIAYSMDEGLQVAKRAPRDIETWLLSRPETVRALTVEDDPAFRRIDLDLMQDNAAGLLSVGS